METGLYYEPPSRKGAPAKTLHALGKSGKVFDFGELEPRLSNHSRRNHALTSISDRSPLSFFALQNAK